MSLLSWITFACRVDLTPIAFLMTIAPYNETKASIQERWHEECHTFLADGMSCEKGIDDHWQLYPGPL